MIAPNDDDCPVGADEALSRLMEGNARFLRGEPRFTQTALEMPADLIKGRTRLQPFSVAALACAAGADFDAKFDLFVVVAGNVVSPEVWGSLQYAGMHLKKTVRYFGRGCGAQAALAAKFRAQERSCISCSEYASGLDVDLQLPATAGLMRARPMSVVHASIHESPGARARQRAA